VVGGAVADRNQCGSVRRWCGSGRRSKTTVADFPNRVAIQRQLHGVTRRPVSLVMNRLGVSVGVVDSAEVVIVRLRVPAAASACSRVAQEAASVRAAVGASTAAEEAAPVVAADLAAEGVAAPTAAEAVSAEEGGRVVATANAVVAMAGAVAATAANSPQSISSLRPEGTSRTLGPSFDLSTFPVSPW